MGAITSIEGLPRAVVHRLSVGNGERTGNVDLLTLGLNLRTRGARTR